MVKREVMKKVGSFIVSSVHQIALGKDGRW
jgi:hypothetical protein